MHCTVQVSLPKDLEGAIAERSEYMRRFRAHDQPDLVATPRDSWAQP
jgi:hypothetical protein